ncbi:MAG: hypothetical protein LBD07_01760 [Spirochaetaceae bacterium]|nr:hypothetical protein [Spirochaetaceae bacterium]
MLSIFFFTDAAKITAQENKRVPLKALVEITTDIIIETKPFTVVIFINYPNPEEVVLELPDFNNEFALERLRSSIHIANSDGTTHRSTDDDGDKWTKIELSLLPAEQGSFIIDGFIISSPEETILTTPLRIIVAPDKTKTDNISLIWTEPRGIRLGDTGEALLKIYGQTEYNSLYSEIDIDLQSPQNAILEKVKLSASDKASGAILRLRIKPIEGKEVLLDRKMFRHQNQKIEVPELRIPILNAAYHLEKTEPVFTTDEFTRTSKIIVKNNNALFPFKHDALGALTLLDGEKCKKLIADAQSCWNERDYTASLALLRSGERDFISGLEFRRFRKSVEMTLGIASMPDEPWTPLRLFFFLSLFSLLWAAATICYFIYRRFIKKYRCQFAVKWFLPAFLIFLLCEGSYINGRLRQGKSAVLQSSPIYNVPEFSQYDFLFFDEGTPAKIKISAELWLYVESETGSAGWIPKNKTSIY